MNNEMLRINYGVNRRKGRKIEHLNGKMRIKGQWLDDSTNKKILRIIGRRHPRWLITGYANVTGQRDATTGSK